MTAPGGERKKLSRRKRLTVAIAAMVLLLGGGAALAIALTGAPVSDATPTPEPSATAAPIPSPEKTPEGEPEPTATHLIAMGDMLPHDSVNENAQTADGGWDYGQFFTGIDTQLKAADGVFCNQEVPSAGVEFGVSGYPTFNAPTEFARDLQGAVGCDLVNLANNHAADKGVAGIAATRAAWDDLDPAIVNGANRNAEEQQVISVTKVGDVKVALVSFAEYSNAPIDGVSLNMMGDDALVSDLITRATESADIVVVSAHWGTEDSHDVNPQQEAFAKKVSDLGADVVIGTGPHVLQKVTWLDRADGERTLVWYSLGNMLNTQLELDQRTGVIAGMDFVRDPDTNEVTVENPTAILTYMHYEWSAQDEAAGNLAARKNLSITPLADSEKLLASTRFGVTAADQFAASAATLGPDVQVLER